MQQFCHKRLWDAPGGSLVGGRLMPAFAPRLLLTQRRAGPWAGAPASESAQQGPPRCRPRGQDDGAPHPGPSRLPRRPPASPGRGAEKAGAGQPPRCLGPGVTLSLSLVIEPEPVAWPQPTCGGREIQSLLGAGSTCTYESMGTLPFTEVALGTTLTVLFSPRIYLILFPKGLKGFALFLKF